MAYPVQLLPIVLFGLVVPHAGAQFLACEPEKFTAPGTAIIVDGGGGNVKFKYAGAVPLGGGSTLLPDASVWAVVVPSSATTPAVVQIGFNPTVTAQLQPGVKDTLFVEFRTVDLTPAGGVSCLVHLTPPKEPPPSIQSVVNTASLQPFLSPGAEVSVIGSHLTGPTLSTNYDPTASYPTSVASTSVTFNGIAAPLLRLSPGKIKAIVPFALAGQTSVQVAVRRFDQVSDVYTIQLQDTAPAIFTATHSGAGQGKILQSPGGPFTYNSPDNPATAGMTLKILATGAGVWTPPAQSDVFLFGETFTTQPVSLTIGGQPAKILHAGTSDTQFTWSVHQVNAIVPDGLSPGPQPVVLTIGENDNTQQQVTIAIQ